MVRGLMMRTEGRFASKVRAFDRSGRPVRITEPGLYFRFLYANDPMPPPREPEMPENYGRKS